ncbi:MAG TPA: thioredoxin domain-containing protein [Candidatus Paceibacterota bacterium]|nr:thioredoxin domain-containing protein [Candidatus Paceibacterota bacterium]
MPQSINPNFYTPIAIVIAGIIIAGAIFVVGRTGSGATPLATGTQQVAAVSASQVSSSGNPTIGSANAPLTIAYWFDYQCPFCKQNELTVMPQLIQDYVNTGKVKIVYKDFSFLGADSDTLGHVARAVWAVAPDKFADWHHAIYANQGEENTGWATTAEIQKITAGVLTAAQTAQVMQLAQTNATKYQSAMDADKQEGEQDGVQGTPAMLIGSQMVAGAESYAQVKTVIDQQLAAVKK